MADENDLKQGENGTSSDGDQSGEETSDSNKETVEVSKSELEQLKEERENYKKGLLSKKQELNELKSDSDNEEESKELPSSNADDLDEPVKKKDFYKSNEKKALQEASDELEGFDENFDKVMQYYTPRRGKETADDVFEDLKDAHMLYKNRHEEPGSNENKSASSKLSAEKSKPKEGSDKAKAEKSKEDLFGDSSSPDEWYENEESE